MREVFFKGLMQLVPKCYSLLLPFYPLAQQCLDYPSVPVDPVRKKNQCGYRSEISENIDQEIIRRREKIRIKFEGFHNIWWSYGYNI